MPERAIETHDLTKAFGKFTAVDALNFDVREGELFGLLGPNGAGKTTTVRMLCTLLEPTRGTATIAGYDLVKEPAEVRRQIGVVSDGVMLYKDLSIAENLRFLSKLYDLSKQESEIRIKELVDLFDFREKTDRRVGALSSGWTKKALIAAALLHKPRILFLDEVTSGLDPQSATALRDFARALCNQGTTIIWTTHYMGEPDKICDRIGIVYGGRMIQMGSPSELKGKVSELSVVEIETPNISSDQIERLRGMGEICNIKYESPMLRISCEKDEEITEKVTKMLFSEGVKIRAINTKEPTLEETFIQLTGGEDEIDRFLEKASMKNNLSNRPSESKVT
jgi:ABC-2 type transport system ATP-binding protein